MLALLLDQQISPEIAVQVRAKQLALPIASIYEWQAGAFIGAADELLLRAAAQKSYTLVTYDRKTIPPLLIEWGHAGTSHGGVIFVDTKTIAPNDFGQLVRALCYYWEQEQRADWTNRIVFLTSAPE